MLEYPATSNGVGLLNEKPLHASLKAWYAQPGDRFEVNVDGSVIDIVRGELLVEIQTRSSRPSSASWRSLSSAIPFDWSSPSRLRSGSFVYPTTAPSRKDAGNHPSAGRCWSYFASW